MDPRTRQWPTGAIDIIHGRDIEKSEEDRAWKGTSRSRDGMRREIQIFAEFRGHSRRFEGHRRAARQRAATAVGSSTRLSCVQALHEHFICCLWTFVFYAQRIRCSALTAEDRL